jgi:HK97 family phage prohead protease
VLIPGAFKESLKRRKPRVVWGHNWNDPIGKVLEIYEVPPSDARLPMKMKAAGIGGLYARVQFNLNSEKGKEAFANVSFFGEEQEWSIGYKTLLASFDQNLQANILKEVELYEVSPVLHGANQLTGTISVKSDDSEEKCPPGEMPGMGQPGMNRPMQPVKPRIPSMPENPLMVSLRRELAQRSGSNVIIRSMTENMAVFDRITSDGMTSTYRVPYHFSGDSFMFGKPERVSALMEDSNPEPAAPPAPSTPQAVTYGNSGPDFTTIASASQDEEKTLEDEITDFLLDGIEGKVGRTINTRNLGKLKNVVQLLQDVISSSEKEVEVKSDLIIEVEPENAFAAKSLLDPIMDYHRVESHVSTKGIVITSGVTPEFIDAVETMQKSLGNRIGKRVGSTGGGGATGKVRSAGRALTGTFDPNAIDADGDKLVQEGTAFERPATPNVARDAKKIERGLRSGNAEVVSKNDLPKELVNDVANAAVRAVGRNGDETRLIDGAKEVLANLTDEKLKDSVGTSVSNARKRLAEMLSDEKVIEEFESRQAIEDFMDEVGYAVQKMIDSHVSSVKKTGTSIEKEEIEEIADNAKDKFDDDFNKLIEASKEFWGKRRKPGSLDKTVKEAKKTAAEDRNDLMTTLREGGAPEDLESTLGSIIKLFGDTSEGITSGTISLEDLNYEIEKAIDQIVENDPSINPEELVNEFGDALREGASKDGANPLIVALAKEFGDEKITGGDLIDSLNDTRQNSVYRPDRGKIEKENIRGLASRGRSFADSFPLTEDGQMPGGRGGFGGGPNPIDSFGNVKRQQDRYKAFTRYQNRGGKKEYEEWLNTNGEDLLTWEERVSRDTRAIFDKYPKGDFSDFREIEPRRYSGDRGLRSERGSGENVKPATWLKDWSTLLSELDREKKDRGMDRADSPDNAYLAMLHFSRLDAALNDAWEVNDDLKKRFANGEDVGSQLKAVGNMITRLEGERNNHQRIMLRNGVEKADVEKLWADRSKPKIKWNGNVPTEINRGLASAGREDSEYARELKKQREKDRAAGVNATNPIGKPETNKPDEGVRSGRRGEGTMLGRPGQIQRDENGNINSQDAANMRKEHDARVFSKLRELGFSDDEIESLTGVPNGGREHPASEKVGLPSKSIRPDSGVKKYSIRLLEEKRDALNDNPSVGVDRKQLDGAWADQVIADLNDGKVDPIDMMGVMQVAMDDIHDKLRSPEKDTNAIEERQKLGKKIRRLLVNNMTDDEKSSSGKFSSSPKGGLSSRTAVGAAGDGKPRKIEMTLSSDERGELLDEIPLLRRHAKDEAPLNLIEQKLREAKKTGRISLTQEEHDSVQQAIIDAMDVSHTRGTREKIVTSDLLSVLGMATESEDGKFVSPNFIDEQNGKRGNTGLRSGMPNNGAPSDMPPNQQRWLIDWAMRNPNLVVGQKILKKHKEGNGQMRASDWNALRSLHKNVTGGRGLRSGRDDANDLPNMTPTGEGREVSRGVGRVASMGQMVGEDISSDSVQAGRGRPMGSGGGIGDSRLKGKRFDDVKPKNWDSMSVDDQYEWLLNDGSRSRSGMSRAAFDGVMNDILLREEKEQAQAERAARRAERASVPAKPVDQASEAVTAAEKPIKVKPRPDNPDSALAERKKDLSTTKKFTDRIADRAVASNNKGKSDDIHKDAWEEIASIMNTEDLTKSQIKEAIDSVDKYLKEAAISDDESDDSLEFQDQAEKLKETLQKLQKYYSKDEFISETPPKPEPKPEKSTSVTPPASYTTYLSARAPSSGGLRSGKPGRTEIKEEATFFRDVEQSLPKEIQAARSGGDKNTAEALSMLQTIISRQEASKLGDRRTNAGRILMTQKEIDDVLDALMVSLDRQVEINGEKRQAMFAKLIDMMAKAAMGTFIDKTTEELQGRTTARRSASGRTVNIQDL